MPALRSKGRLLPLFLLPAFLFASQAAAQKAEHLVVDTAQGKVEGTLAADGSVRQFRGIPYAAAPVGDLRWQAPQPALKHAGTLAAHDFGNRCMQTNPFADMVFRDPGQSEDCLNLNVWAPKGAKPGSLPVMVWVYGGGFTAGAASEARHDGQFLARHDVIVVSMNYRLGVFGFFVHPGLTAESPHHASGNYGLLDQAAALAWVRENIRGFGGDPNNITIFGESAGSFSVSALMASPLSKGLIAKAIGESGAAFSSGSLNFPTRATREVSDPAFARAAYGTDDLAALRKLSTAEILAGAESKTIHAEQRISADVDGYFLPKSVPEIYAAGEQAHVPLLAGWNADEGRAQVVYAKPPVTAASFAAEAKRQYGEDAPAFLAAYGGATDAEAIDAASAYAGDRFIAYSTWLWLEAQLKTGGAPVYRYLFSLGSPGDKFHPAAMGAYHSDEIDYVFGTLDQRNVAVWRPEDRRLSSQMQLYWTNFARTGDPNGRGSDALPVWPAYKPEAFEFIRLDAITRATPDDHRARYLFLQAHP